MADDGTSLLDSLIDRRKLLLNTLEGSIAHARDIEGRSSLNNTELALMGDIRGLNEHIASMSEDAERGDHSALSSRINGTSSPAARAAADLTAIRGGLTSSSRKTAMNDHRNLTYRKGDPRHSYLIDFMKVGLNRDDDYSARSRLASHAREVAEDPAYQEQRDLSRVDGEGGYAVPPAWLMDQFIELARPGRAFANLCSMQNLPAGTDSINIPKILTGTATGIQTADNTSVVDVDLTDTFINAPVRTISGQQSVALQLLDQSPISFDEIIFRDLTASYATQVDLQCLYGTGSSGQVLGLDLTPGISTLAVSEPTIGGIYSAIANGIQTIHTTRFLPPQVVLMHPRRWGWLLSLLDNSNRPLFIPEANHPMNAAGILTDVDSQCVVGQVAGLPIVTDPNLSITQGSESGGGDEDYIYILRSSDITLWESGQRMRVEPSIKAQNLTVVLITYGYLAFSAQRYPASVVELTGLPTPSF